MSFVESAAGKLFLHVFPTNFWLVFTIPYTLVLGFSLELTFLFPTIQSEANSVLTTLVTSLAATKQDTYDGSYI